MGWNRECSGHMQEYDRVLSIYLKEIGRIPMISREEECELGRRIQSGDQRATTRLVEGNLRFVVSIAKKYISPRLTTMDMISEGNLGLFEAARRFDPDRGVRFVTYAVWWIRQSIMQSLAIHGYPVKLPLKKANLKQRIIKSERSVCQEHHRSPSNDELASLLNENTQTIETILQATRETYSVDVMTLDEDRRSLGLLCRTVNQSAEQTLMTTIMVDEVRDLMKKLTLREAEVIHLHFGLNEDGERLTLEEIGKNWGMTKEGVRQIESKATSKLRMHCNFVPG